MLFLKQKCRPNLKLSQLQRNLVVLESEKTVLVVVLRLVFQLS